MPSASHTRSASMWKPLALARFRMKRSPNWSPTFDLRPGAIIHDLDLRRPIYRKIAAYGHFGRDDLDLTWERTEKAAALKKAAGI